MATDNIDYDRVARVWSERLHTLMLETERGLDDYERKEATLIAKLIELALKKDALGVFCTLNAIADLARAAAKEEKEKRLKMESELQRCENDYFVIRTYSGGCGATVSLPNSGLATPCGTGALSPIAVWAENMAEDAV